ncbi:hypothetical protein [Pseudomonas sp. Z4-20]|uniref:hypothetical protein n=1 Tax=Pseudomonas sp. Z4-20 TaxID=2817414 RepID=UPI003DA7C2E4
MIPVDTPEAAASIGEARERLKAYEGAVLPFVRLCKIFLLQEDQHRMAELTELLCSKKVRLMKHVYFYLDDQFGPILLKDGIVKHYLKFDELYHPVSNSIVEGVDVEEKIIIEFEVLG